RNRNGLSPKQTLDVYVQTKDKVFYEVCNDILLKISNINPINYTDTNIENAITNLVDKDKVFIVTGIEINTDEEKEKLKKEILYYEGFITSIEKKLNNERFVQNAKPEIVEIERQKLKDGQTKLQAFKESLSKLG
nr:valine--tRNA ligase [Chitinophagales bacterium]